MAYMGVVYAIANVIKKEAMVHPTHLCVHHVHGDHRPFF